ncbi:MAG: hypothetical protein KKC71_00510 [Chloroflexi bacterium]|nr:hypothetical protein [Chloroflexota bacterium]
MTGLSRRAGRLGELIHIARMARQVASQARPAPDRSTDRSRQSLRPVIFFNASTRLSGLSQNAAFSLLTSWAVRLAGAPVIHFVCQRGMSRCLLGTDESDPSRPMPCGMCVRQSRANYTGAQARYFTYQRDEALAAALEDLSLDELLRYQHPLNTENWSLDTDHWSLNTDLWSLVTDHLPLGALVLPSLRWRLRLQTLSDDEPTRFLCREFILSAWNVAREFNALLETVKPQAVVFFNGMHFPEATAAWLCRQRGVRVITHESGFQPFSGYFVEGQVTAYPITIPDVELTPEQNARLDADLQKRWQGDFSMADIKFWNEMRGLPEELARQAAAFKQVTAVFTNVIFDTTQLHANVTFADMFAWLDALLEVIRAHPETLFIVRAHPDEARPGKASRESVAMWVEQSGAAALPNLVFIPPQERISSYELIRRSKFVLIYNSTIGLEATLLGVPVLAAARAPFTDYGTAFFEPQRESYLRRLEAFLTADSLKATGKLEASSRGESRGIPEEAVTRTRRFMYYRYYRFSLPFGAFLESSLPTGYVRLKKFSWRDLFPEKSPTLRALLDGLFHGKRFELDV